jgi:hypothetical protein
MGQLFQSFFARQRGGNLPFDLELTASVLATLDEIAYQAFKICIHGRGWALACK